MFVVQTCEWGRGPEAGHPRSALAGRQRPQLGADSVEDLTITVTAVKGKPSITVDSPLEAPAYEPAAGTPSKTEQRELDRHPKLRDQGADAFAAVETSDHPLDSDEGRKLADKRDQIAGKLKLAAQRGTCHLHSG
jgi:hypothetical protein